MRLIICSMDFLYPLLQPGANRFQIQLFTYVSCCNFATGSRQVAPVKDQTHHFSGVLQVRLGPDVSLGIGTIVILQLNQTVADRKAVFSGHELHVARIGGGDDRFTKVHGLGHSQAEPFGAVQRNEGVCGSHQAEHLIILQVPADKADLSTFCRLLQESGHILGVVGVYALYDQGGLVFPGEGRLESLDHPQRILPLENTQIVEDEEE